MIFSVDSFTASVAIFILAMATLVGIAIRAYIKIQSSNVRFSQPVFGTLMELIFLISLTIMWILVFSKLL